MHPYTLLFGTGSAKPGVIEDGLADRGTDKDYLVLWHEPHHGDHAGLRVAIKWMLANDVSFDIIAPKGVNFPQQITQVAEVSYPDKDIVNVMLPHIIENDPPTDALCLFPATDANGMATVECMLEDLCGAKIPVYELNNGCTPLSIVLEMERPKPEIPKMIPMIDEIEEGDALERMSGDELTMDLTLLSVLIRPDGSATWRRVTPAEAEVFFNIKL